MKRAIIPNNCKLQNEIIHNYYLKNDFKQFDYFFLKENNK